MEYTETKQMPHPERAREPLLGSDDGKWIFESLFAALKNKPSPRRRKSRERQSDQAKKFRS